jgi:hypothetical protein
VIDCDEGSLHWVPLDKVDELPLVDDLRILLPRLFGNGIPEKEKGAITTPFFAHVHYDQDDQLVIRFAE